ncbi:MAG: DUF998 domain-containing protein, partial [Dehalococcoidia bacterium]|nr:DUF998 domain-containing protein [Dehalococcoidia bacterium]
SVFNLLGLMTSGALVVVLSAGLHAELGGNRLARIASPLLAVSGISLFMTGIFPCDVGVAEPTASGMLHGFFAAAGTLAIIGAALATGLGMMRDAVWRNYARFSLCVTAVAVALYLPYQFDLFARWEGAVQRMLVLILLVWLEVMSIKLLGRSWAKASSESDRASRGCTEC